VTATAAATLPLLRGFEPDDVMGWHRGRPMTASRFCHAVATLAARLPHSRYAFNLCESHFHFLVGAAAALASGQTLILPPTRIPAMLATLRQTYADNCCLIDMATPQIAAVSDSTIVVEIAAEEAADWPPPSVTASHQAAILFTSGSTKEPQPQRKRWMDLVNGTDTLVKSLGAPPRGTAIVGTVAAQHMFGFETTVMLPLQSGTPVLDLRPAYPADLAATLAAATELGIDGVWLMTTPLQLRAFHRELQHVSGLRRITASTMPLDRELAQAVENDWRVRVDEIYGCTEGGILATRRAAQASHFTPGAGLAFTLTETGHARVAGGHLPEPLTLTDRIRLCSPDGKNGDGGFELLGRDEDIVKIAGKRASLAGLTRHLLAIRGVRDGIVFLPDAAAPRVTAVVVAPGLSVTDVRGELATRIDPAFMPRPLVMVDALPRDANGKLPLAALRQMIDTARREMIHSTRLETIDTTRHEMTDGAQRDRTVISHSRVASSMLTRQCSVSADHPVLSGHFPGQPIVPGVLLLQMVQSMLEEAGYRVRACPEVKFRAPVEPETAIELRVEIADRHTAHFVAQVGGKPAMNGTFICDNDTRRS
jgi:acyl-coenzyme A synthetase/AMP-(fatty) acid ligase/3-hydroxymyristoyl/3-hydroxydecanoyl-(acyl carrier protein) dehydratase